MPFITPSELNTHLYGEVVTEISRANAAIAQAAIDTAISEVSGFLSVYDRTAIFAAAAGARNAALLNFTKDIAVWHFIQLCNPGVDLALRQDRYDRAIKWLDKVQSGKVVPDLPYPAPVTDLLGNVVPPENSITWGSNPKRQNNY